MKKKGGGGEGMEDLRNKGSSYPILVLYTQLTVASGTRRGHASI